MAIFKRGRYYWFEFIKDGVRFRKTTKQRNYQAAKDIESAFRTALAKGDVGITERPKVPTLASFRQRFLDEISIKCAEHPATIDFYTRKYDGLLSFKPLASAALDRIDEELISRFTAQMIKDKYQRSTVNHHLRTLKRALRLAARWKLISGAPYVDLLDGENEREYVLPRDQEHAYLSACAEFLRNAAAFMLETGLRRKELIGLEWRDVHFQPVGNAKRGYIAVRGTKSRNSKRNLSLTEQARNILLRQQQVSKCDAVFVMDTAAALPASPSGLDHAHERVREQLGLDSEFVLHSLRHTFGTRLGEAGADAFTIMRIMGHSSIVVSQRYVHPTPETMENAIVALEIAAKKAQVAARKAQHAARSKPEIAPAQSVKTVPTKVPTAGSRMVN